MFGSASQATLRTSEIGADRVTVNSASEPSATSLLGPLRLRSARLVLMIVTVAGNTTMPSIAAFRRTVSSPSTTESVAGVNVKVLMPYS